MVLARPRPGRVGPDVRFAQGCKLRLAGLSLREPSVADAERGTGWLSSEARRIAGAWRRRSVISNGKFDDYVGNYAAIIAEVRARQPQARILLFGTFPRSAAHAGRQANAALSRLANNETVFFIDISDLFFRPDGSHNDEMWIMSGPPNAGIHAPAFEVWAEVLQPWLDRFVR